MLWKGKRLGYQLATATWAYMVVAALYSLVVLHMHVTPSFELNEVNHVLYLKPLSNGLGKLLWGLPILYILIRDLTTKAPSEPHPTKNLALSPMERRVKPNENR